MKNFEKSSRLFPPQETPKAERSEIKITPEQKAILESAKAFVKYLTSRWPQVDTRKKLVIKIDDEGTTVELPELPKSIETETIINYYFCGSLAFMLLSCA